MRQSREISMVVILTAILLILSSLIPVVKAEVIDRIVAVVGDYPILQSEVDFQLQLWAMQQGRKVTKDEVSILGNDLLDQMINDKLILIKALKDTSINIPSEQVEDALNSRLEELKSRFPNQSAFEQQMAMEGLTYRELKSKFREEMRNQLYKDRLISRELSKVSITPAEVDEFFHTYKDSLPLHPEAVKIAHILLEVEPSQETLDSAKARAQRVLDMINDGGDFAELAQEYSEDPSAEAGGDLGYFGRGDLVKEFEDAAYALKIGEVSDIVKTQFGYHIIKLEDKQTDRIRVRHILFLTEPTESDVEKIKILADSLIQEIKNGAEFVEIAKDYSIDDETKKQGGELGWFVYEDMTPEFKAAVEGLESGDLSRPTESHFGIHIIQVQDRQKSREWSLEEDRDRLKELARRQKTEEVVNRLLAELKEQTYIDVRL